jgi:HEPN domain-containing protein
MLEKVTLLDRANADLAVAKLITACEKTDESQIDIAAYHLQQAVEKSLKFMLNSAGRSHPRTHDIYVLAQQLDRYKFAIPEWVMENADVLNEYETRTRYGAQLVASRSKIEGLLGLVEGLINDLDPKISKVGGKYSPGSYF